MQRETCMDFETDVVGPMLHVKVLAERIDAACAIQFKDKMRELTEGDTPRVLLDLSNVDFLDSSGLGAVVSAMKHIGAGRSLELAGLRPKVEKVFRLTRMDRVFTIHPDAQTPLTDVSEQKGVA